LLVLKHHFRRQPKTKSCDEPQQDGKAESALDTDIFSFTYTKSLIRIVAVLAPLFAKPAFTLVEILAEAL
jgi:hypothetical protein